MITIFAEWEQSGLLNLPDGQEIKVSAGTLKEIRHEVGVVFAVMERFVELMGEKLSRTHMRPSEMEAWGDLKGLVRPDIQQKGKGAQGDGDNV